MEDKGKVIHISTPVARKEHICAICGKPMTKGERYLNIVIKKDGRIYNRKTHLGCTEKSEQPNIVLQPGLSMTEEQFKQAIHEDTHRMLDTFTFEENMQIAFTPLIITEVAWRYAYMALDYAATNRVSETKKLSRMVKGLREKYLSECRKDLDNAHMKKMEKASEVFAQICGNDLLILYYSFNNELKKQWPYLENLEMRTYAGIAIIMLQLLEEHNDRMDKLMESKLGRKVPSYRNPVVECLVSFMKAYMKPVRFRFEGNVRMSMQIMQKKFNQQAKQTRIWKKN